MKHSIPSLTNRGHGIGRHNFNDTRATPAGFVTVREIIVSDVFGEGTLRYNLDTRVVTRLDGTDAPVADPRWSWAQVAEVVSRDLARHHSTAGRKFGDAYGSFYDNTAYGLWNGKRPRWMDKASWARRMNESLAHAPC